MASGYLLRLFITGHTLRSRRAIADLREICENELGGLYELEVIDVAENPEAAAHEHVVATPTLIRELPLPVRRIIGDLSDHEKVLHSLALVPLKRGRA